jgi:hypothetical protein
MTQQVRHGASAVERARPSSRAIALAHPVEEGRKMVSAAIVEVTGSSHWGQLGVTSRFYFTFNWSLLQLPLSHPDNLVHLAD